MDSLASPALAFRDGDLVLRKDFREKLRGRSFPGIQRLAQLNFIPRESDLRGAG